jgi:hypothetical protein
MGEMEECRGRHRRIIAGQRWKNDVLGRISQWVGPSFGPNCKQPMEPTGKELNIYENDSSFAPEPIYSNITFKTRNV